MPATRNDKFGFSTEELSARDKIAEFVDEFGIARVTEMVSDIALDDARKAKRDGDDEAKNGHAAVARTLEVVAQGIDKVVPV
jgi:hypothetical protein